VLEVISNEKLVSSAKMVGRSLQSSLRKLVDKHPTLGDIRGSGLVWGIEVVTNKQENLPDSSLATDIMYRLKGKQVRDHFWPSLRPQAAVVGVMCP